MKDKKQKKVNPYYRTRAFALPIVLDDKITAEARKEDRTPSYIIRRIVKEYFEGKE